MFYQENVWTPEPAAAYDYASQIKTLEEIMIDAERFRALARTYECHFKLAEYADKLIEDGE